MIIALCVLTYFLIGWIVASVCLTISIYIKDKTELSTDFVLPFCLWPIISIVSVFILIGEIIFGLGRITEKVISKLMKGETKK